MRKYYYIIKRGGMVFEIPFTIEDYQAALQARRNGGVLWVKPMGFDNPQDINVADIATILDYQGYETYIKCERPKTYLKDGIWYDGKEGRQISVEDWREKKRQEQKKLQEESEEERLRPLTPEEIKANKKRLAKMRDTLVERKIISPHHRPTQGVTR